MICKNCGSEVADTDVYCMNCGAPVEKGTTAEKICLFCGSREDGDAAVCSNCGHAFSGGKEWTDDVGERRRKSSNSNNSKTIILLALIIILIAALGAMGLFFIKYINEAEENERRQQEIIEQVEEEFKEKLEDEVKVKVEEELEKAAEEREVQPQETEATIPEEKIIVVMPPREEHNNNDYIFPSDRKYITLSDLLGRTKEEVALMRNEIYARHGYIFSNEVYRRYFMSKSWYKPNPNFNESMLTEIESKNKSFIVEYEKSMGWR